MTRACSICGGPIPETRRAGATLCGAVECAREHKSRWQRAMRGQRACLRCLTPIATPRARYCGAPCYQEARRDYMRERGQRPDLRERTRQWQATALQEKLDAEPDYARAFAEHTRAAKARYLARTPPEQIAETKRASRGRARLRKLMEMFNGQR